MFKLVLLGPGIWLLKSIVYWVIFRIRTIEASATTCLVVAGAPVLLAFIPFPLPWFLSFALSIAVAVYLTMHYTGVELLPDGLCIPLGVECVFGIGIWVIRVAGSKA